MTARRFSSFDLREGLAFDEHTQSWIQLDDATSEDDGDEGMTAEDDDELVGKSYDIRTLVSENAKLKTQLAAALQKIADMERQREQELKDDQRLGEQIVAGMRQLGEIRQTFAEQDERDLMSRVDEIARSRHGMSYKRLVERDYNAAVRVLADADRRTSR